MRSSVKRKRKWYLAVVSVMCFLYTAHVSISTFMQLNEQCQTVHGSQLESNKVLSISSREVIASYLNYTKQAKHEALARRSNVSEEFNRTLVFLNLTRTDYFTCEDFKKLPATTQAVSENLQGNRGVSFLKLRIANLTIPAVYKEASRVLQTFADEYKYNSAKREVEYLIKLRGLPGIPRIFGSCIKESSVKYFAERIMGHTICNDNGTTPNCSKGVFILQTVSQAPDPTAAALKVAYTTVRLFKLLEERHLVLEDVSGINFMFSKEFEIYMVDADSLVFYNQTRLFSKLLCTTDEHCPGPSGNLWSRGSLNSRIYSSCADLSGICENERCRGFDSSLHACGIANWYFCPLKKFFSHLPDISKEFEKVCTCMRQIHPQHRCSFTTATSIIYRLMKSYSKKKGD